MTLEEIMSNWEKDSVIDRTELGDEAIRIAKLHHKYYNMLSNERLILRKYEMDMKTLKLEKYEFYTQGPNEETVKKGWRMPASGKILKSEVGMYLEADADVLKQGAKTAMQQEKVDALDSMVKSLNNRGYNIKAAIDWIRFTNGG